MPLERITVSQACSLVSMSVSTTGPDEGLRVEGMEYGWSCMTFVQQDTVEKAKITFGLQPALQRYGEQDASGQAHSGKEKALGIRKPSIDCFQGYQ